MLQYGASQIEDVNMHQLGVGQSVKLKIENVHFFLLFCLHIISMNVFHVETGKQTEIIKISRPRAFK